MGFDSAVTIVAHLDVAYQEARGQEMGLQSVIQRSMPAAQRSDPAGQGGNLLQTPFQLVGYPHHLPVVARKHGLRILVPGDGAQKTGDSAGGSKDGNRVQLIQNLQKIRAKCPYRGEPVVADQRELFLGELAVPRLKNCSKSNDVVEVVIVQIYCVDKTMGVSHDRVSGKRVDLPQLGHGTSDASTDLAAGDDPWTITFDRQAAR